MLCHCQSEQREEESGIEMGRESGIEKRKKKRNKCYDITVMISMLSVKRIV